MTPASYRFYLNIFILVIAVVVATGCAPMSSGVEQEADFNFEKHKTYNIVSNTQEDLINLPLKKAKIDRVVTKTIDDRLSEKGYSITSDKPEMLVSYYLVTNAKTDTFVVNQYYTNMGFRQPPGRSSTRDSQNFQEVTYEEGIIIIDVIDAKTNQRVWQGHVATRKDVYEDEQRKEKQLAKEVNKILSYVPTRQNP